MPVTGFRGAIFIINPLYRISVQCVIVYKNIGVFIYIRISYNKGVGGWTGWAELVTK